MFDPSNYEVFNTVLYEGKHARIESINGDFYDIQGKHVLVEELSPVLLTMNIKNNLNSDFLSINDPNILLFTSKDLQITINLDTTICVVISNINQECVNEYKDIKYLHQFQNIIYKHTNVRLLSYNQ